MRVNCSLTLAWTSWCSRSQKRVPQSSAGRCRNWREKSALASISRMLLSSLAIHIPEQSKNDLRTPPPAWGEAASLIGFLRLAAAQPRRNHRNGPWLDGRKPTAFSRLRSLCAAAARGGIGHLSEIWQPATVIEAVEAEGSAGVV